MAKKDERRTHSVLRRAVRFRVGPIVASRATREASWLPRHPAVSQAAGATPAVARAAQCDMRHLSGVYFPQCA